MKQNPYNLLSYQNIHKFGTSISHFVEKFTSSIGMKKGYISKYLPYADSQILKYLNPDDDTKKLKVEDLIIILDNSDEKTIINILDSLCNLYGGSFNFHSTSCPVESFENLFMQLTSENGKLAADYIRAIEDKKIDKKESKDLNIRIKNLKSFLLLIEKKISEDCNND